MKYKKNHLFLFCLCVMSFAAQSATKPVITITPAHATDWKYKVGGKATFKVAVTNADTAMKKVEIKNTIGYEKQQPLITINVILSDGT